MFSSSKFTFSISIYYIPEPEKKSKCNLIIYSGSSEDSIRKLTNEIHKRWLNILRSNEKDYLIIFYFNFILVYFPTLTLKALIIIPIMFSNKIHNIKELLEDFGLTVVII